MTREERLQFCQTCTLRKMDLNQGLICSITGNRAEFEDKCPDFIKDENEEINILQRNLAAAGNVKDADPVNFKKNKENGVLIFCIGLIITLATHTFSEEIGFFVITYGAMIYGVRLYFKGVEQEKIIKAHQDNNISN